MLGIKDLIWAHAKKSLTNGTTDNAVTKQLHIPLRHESQPILEQNKVDILEIERLIITLHYDHI